MAPKIAQRREHTGEFAQDQIQRLAQTSLLKINEHADSIESLQAPGIRLLAMMDRDQGVSPTAPRNVIKMSGANTSNHFLTLPGATDREAYFQDVCNVGSGSHIYVRSTLGSAVVGVRSGQWKRLFVDSRGVTDTSDFAAGTIVWGELTSGVVSKIPLVPLATTGATTTTILSYPVQVNTMIDFAVTVTGRRTGGVSGTAGDAYRANLAATYQRIGTAGPTLVGAAATETSKRTNGGGSGYASSLSVSSNNILIRVTGVATTNIDWTARADGIQLS